MSGDRRRARAADTRRVGRADGCGREAGRSCVNCSGGRGDRRRCRAGKRGTAGSSDRVGIGPDIGCHDPRRSAQRAKRVDRGCGVEGRAERHGARRAAAEQRRGQCDEKRDPQRRRPEWPGVLSGNASGSGCHPTNLVSQSPESNGARRLSPRAPRWFVSKADYSAASVVLAGRGSRRSAIRADLPVRPRR